jgi:serine/threonine-protein kinase TNNI3K
MIPDPLFKVIFQLNVLITHSGQACLADFGLSFAVDTTATVTQDSSANPGGTMRFQAPELINPQVQQWHNKATDIYTLACIFYEVSQQTMVDIICMHMY